MHLLTIAAFSVSFAVLLGPALGFNKKCRLKKMGRHLLHWYWCSMHFLSGMQSKTEDRQEYRYQGDVIKINDSPGGWQGEMMAGKRVPVSESQFLNF